MRGGALCQRPRTHSQGTPRFRLSDLWTQQARPVFALERDEAAGGVQHGDRERLQPRFPRMFQSAIDDDRCPGQLDHDRLLVQVD